MIVKRSKPQAGQNLVEFSLVVTLLLIFIFVIIDLGRITYYYSVLHNAAREGARYGIVHPTDLAGAQKYAEDFALGLNPDELSVTPSIQDGGDSIQIVAEYIFRPVTPILSWLIGGDNEFTLSSTSRMRIEQ
jgi:Flp pilus assembly protein TadG